VSEHDDIRRALEELSSHPPHRDRKPAVRGRIAVVRRRHQVVGGVAATVVTLLAGIAFASLGGGRGPLNDALLQTPSVTPTPAPSPAPSPPSSAPAASAKAAPVKTPAVAAGSAGGNIAPAQTAVTVPQASKSDSADAGSTGGKIVNPSTSTSTVTIFVSPPSSSLPTSTKPSLAAPPSSGSTGSATPSGTTSSTAPSGEKLSADISADTIQDGSAAPETVVTVRVHGTIVGSVGSVMAWYTTTHHAGYTDSQARACNVQDGKLHDVDDLFTFRTRYRAAGMQHVDAVVTTLDPTCAAGASEREWPFAATVTIPVGSSLSNGVAPVTLTVGAATVQGSRISLTADADDPDGYVSAFSVNWGSGAPDTFPGGNGANCSATEYGSVFWPSGGGSGTFASPVLPAGTYSVTVTATATGCDGNNSQSVQQKLTVVVP
jgi:hypothetical protein